MSTKNKILEFLRQDDHYISGENLSARLGISRAAVWKAVQSLRAEGFQVESSTNRGYRLSSTPEPYSPAAIQTGLGTKVIGKDIFCSESLDSTNEEAKRRALNGSQSGSIFLAEQQSHGKGRLGRTWASPPGTGLWFSILLREDLLPRQITCITLLTGLAVCQAIRSHTGLEAKIKWPNDVVIGSRKVCGILTETTMEEERVSFAVVGIGVNTNMQSFPKELSEKACSLYMETGHCVSRILLLQEILRRLETYLILSHESEEPFFISEYKEFCCSLNKKVTFWRGAQQLEGIAVDITLQGDLLVKTEEGGAIPVHSGEVSVQGIYGHK